MIIGVYYVSVSGQTHRHAQMCVCICSSEQKGTGIQFQRYYSITVNGKYCVFWWIVEDNQK